MLFAQLSDPHIMGPGENPHGTAPAGANLSRAIAQINAMKPRPAFVMVTGDITDKGLEEHAREAARLLSALDIQWFVIPGNHDRRESLRAAFPQENLPGGDDGFLHYAFSSEGMRFIALDTLHPGRPGGRLCAARLAWLKARLDEEPDAPTVLFMHHSPVKFGILETDEDGFEGADELGDLLRERGNVARIMCGHTHLSLFAPWHGVIVSTAPTTSGMRLALDLTMQKPSAFHLDDAAWHLHRLTDGGIQTFYVSAHNHDTQHLF